MSNLTRFDPIDDLFRGFFVKPMDFPNGPAQVASFRVDIREREGAYVIHADLPGVRKDDIQVQVDGNIVAISTEVKQEKDTKEAERVLRSERYVGKVSRSFQLAQDVDEESASAKFQDGVLELTLPKKKAVAARRLTIQ